MNQREVAPTEESAVMVILLTSNYKVAGNLYVPIGKRITDVISDSDQFIAVTGVQVWDRTSGRKLFNAAFIDVDRDEIEILVPAKEIQTDGEDIGHLGTWLWDYRKNQNPGA